MKRSFFGLAALFVVGMLALPASADSLTQGFEGPNWASGTPLVGAEGWTYTGGSSYDVGIEPNGIDGQSVRTAEEAVRILGRRASRTPMDLGLQRLVNGTMQPRAVRVPR